MMMAKVNSTIFKIKSKSRDRPTGFEREKINSENEKHNDAILFSHSKACDVSSLTFDERTSLFERPEKE